MSNLHIENQLVIIGCEIGNESQIVASAELDLSLGGGFGAEVNDLPD